MYDDQRNSPNIPTRHRHIIIAAPHEMSAATAGSASRLFLGLRDWRSLSGLCKGGLYSFPGTLHT